MAFTDTQKRDIRKYLGVPFGFYYLNHRLESGMGMIGENATDSAEIVAILTELATIDAALATAGTSANATGLLKQVDEVQFYDGQQSAGYIAPGALQRGRTLIARLARDFGCSDYLPIGDYFSAARSGGFEMELG